MTFYYCSDLQLICDVIGVGPGFIGLGSLHPVFMDMAIQAAGNSGGANSLRCEYIYTGLCIATLFVSASDQCFRDWPEELSHCGQVNKGKVFRLLSIVYQS